jgi:hypothetical protein
MLEKKLKMLQKDISKEKSNQEELNQILGNQQFF